MSLTKGARFGLYAVVTMARRAGERVSARAVAEDLAISENHVAKVLQLLTRAGIVASVRGVGGGYTLARDATHLTMLDVVECVEGPMRHLTCETCPFRNKPMCPDESAACTVHHVLAELASHAYYTMKSVTIATLAGVGSDTLNATMEI